LYASGVIVNFRDRRTERLYGGTALKGVPADVLRRAVNKLTLLDTAVSL
jgi:toxin HigB-1